MKKLLIAAVIVISLLATRVCHAELLYTAPSPQGGMALTFDANPQLTVFKENPYTCPTDHPNKMVYVADEAGTQIHIGCWSMEASGDANIIWVDDPKVITPVPKSFLFKCAAGSEAAKRCLEPSSVI